MIFPLDQGSLKELLEEFSKIRKLTLVSKNANEKKLTEMNLLGGNEISFNFITNENKSISQIFLGKNNFSGEKIYIKTPSSPVYEGKDDFFPWLHTTPRLWANMNLVSTELLGMKDFTEVQRIIATFSNGNSQKKYTSSEGNFTDIASKILRLRGGNIISPSAIESIPVIMELKIETGNKNAVILKFYQKDATSYLVLPVYTTAIDIENKIHFCFEISAWTFNTIYELLAV